MVIKAMICNQIMLGMQFFSDANLYFYMQFKHREMFNFIIYINSK